jgi:hypothetical protein
MLWFILAIIVFIAIAMAWWLMFCSAMKHPNNGNELSDGQSWANSNMG